MKKIVFWGKAVVTDSVAIAFIVFGAVTEIAPLLSAVLFLAWLNVVLLVLGIIFWNQMAAGLNPGLPKWRIYRTRTWKAYDVVTDAALILALSAMEHFFLAGLLFFGKLIFKGQLYRWIEKEVGPEGRSL